MRPAPASSTLGAATSETSLEGGVASPEAGCADAGTEAVERRTNDGGGPDGAAPAASVAPETGSACLDAAREAEVLRLAGLLGAEALGAELAGATLGLGVTTPVVGLLGVALPGARPMLRPGGGAITSGRGAAENMRATASSPVMLLRTRFGRRPIGLGAPRSRAFPVPGALCPLHAPGRAPRRPRISDSASAPPTFGIGGSARRAASRAALLAPPSRVADGVMLLAASSGERPAVDGVEGDVGVETDADTDGDRPLASDTTGGELCSTEAACARRAAGVDSSTTARRRVGAPEGEELLEGVTVTD